MQNKSVRKSENENHRVDALCAVAASTQKSFLEIGGATIATDIRAVLQVHLRNAARSASWNPKDPDGFVKSPKLHLSKSRINFAKLALFSSQLNFFHVVNVYVQTLSSFDKCVPCVTRLLVVQL